MGAALTVRTSLLGLGSWLIPFVVSFLLFDRAGRLLISQPLFKSIMVLVGGVSGAALLVVAFRQIPSSVGPRARMLLAGEQRATGSCGAGAAPEDAARALFLRHRPALSAHSDHPRQHGHRGLAGRHHHQDGLI